ncbi:MAG TPA: hypothetical protein VFT68_18785 [Lapillicoccus sp.]|nr:hypothetical protein [Lapillicoccus sp.]
MSPLVRRLTAVGGAALLAASLAGCASVAGISDAPTATVGGAVSSSRAQSIAAQVIDTAGKAAATPGADGDALRDAAFTGDALTAAKADAKLAGTLTQDQKDALALTDAPPVVLAVSNGLGYPRSMVVQTTRAKSGLPVLSLLVTPDVRTPFKIAASAPMLPATEVPAFDQVTQGAPSLGDDPSGLAVEPEKLAAAYATSLAYPAPPPTTDAPFTDDAFANKIKAAAKDQADKIASVGTFTEQHLAKDVAGGLRLAGDRGALAFTVLERKDTVLNKTTGTINVSDQFKALTGLASVKAEATLDTLEFVVFVIPASGQAQAVAAEEHLVAATGT